MKQRAHIPNYLLAALVRLLSYLPLGVLYGVSGLFYFVMVHVTRYRRNVVLQNLRNSFPGKSEKEIRRISKVFFRHLADVTAETIKLLTISDKEILRRCRFEGENKALMEQYFSEGRSFIGLLGHTGNWEWVPPLVTLSLPYDVIPAYRPFRDKVIDKLMLDIRGRYTYELVPKQLVGRAMLRYKREGRPIIMGLIADQSPGSQPSYSTTFLSQETMVISGPEKLARMYNLPVFFVSLRKQRRGYYDFYTELLTENPTALAEGELSKMFMQRLEAEILNKPPYWLWSHRRWKRRKV